MPSDSVLYLAKRTELIITAVLLSKPFLTKLVYSQSCMLRPFFCNMIIEHLKRVFKQFSTSNSVSAGSVSDTTGKKTNSPHFLSVLAAFKSCLVLWQHTSTCSVNNSHDKDEPVWVCIIAKKEKKLKVKFRPVISLSDWL